MSESLTKDQMFELICKYADISHKDKVIYVKFTQGTTEYRQIKPYLTIADVDYHYMVQLALL